MPFPAILDACPCAPARHATGFAEIMVAAPGVLTEAPALLTEAPPGRSREAGNLRDLLSRTLDGEKHGILLIGAAGIGKTTMLQWLCRVAEETGCAPALVRVPAARGLPPRYLIRRIVDGLAGSAAERGIAFDIEPFASALGTPAAVPAIIQALETFGGRSPLAILVDDYHWVSRDESELLIGCLRAVEVPLLVCATVRRAPGETGPPLPEPNADLWFDEQELRGLDPETVGAIATDILGGPVLPSLGRLLDGRTLGNPLFLAETLRCWMSEGDLVQVGGHWGLREDGDGERTPRLLRELVLTRFSRLGPEALTLAHKLAVLGREATFGELLAASGRDGDVLVQAISDLCEQGLMADDGQFGNRYSLAHPLYASSLLCGLNGARKAEIHGRIYHALREVESRGSVVSRSELAHHAIRGLEQPSDIQELLLAAGREAEKHESYEDASVWYELMEQKASGDETVRFAALRLRAEAVCRFDPACAAEIYNEALALARDQAQRFEILVGRAKALRRLGSFERALADLEDAVRIAPPESGFEVRLAIGVIHAVQGRVDLAEENFRALAAESEGTDRQFVALEHLATAAFVRGRLREARDLFESLAGSKPEECARSIITPNLAWLKVLLGEWEQAEALLRPAIALAESSSDTWRLTPVLGTAARLMAWRGNLDEAFDHASAAVRFASRLGNPAGLIESRDALAIVFLENEMPAEAAGVMADVPALITPDLEPRELSLSMSVLAEAHVALGDLVAAEACARVARAALDANPYWDVAVDRLDAMIALAAGEAPRAIEIARSRLDHPSPIVFWQAGIVEVLARATLEAGRPDEGLARAAEAERIYARLGARLRVARVKRWIAAHQINRGGRPRSELPGGVTQRELEVLRLILAGRTNPEIAHDLTITVSTAKKHVEHLMAKASASRRTELVSFALRVGLPIADASRPLG